MGTLRRLLHRFLESSTNTKQEMGHVTERGR